MRKNSIFAIVNTSETSPASTWLCVMCGEIDDGGDPESWFAGLGVITMMVGIQNPGLLVWV